MRYLVMLTPFALALGGCAGGGMPPMKAYGEFCGPGHPRLPQEIASIVDENVRQERSVDYMLNILKPGDHIDAACQAHDICYEKHGMFNSKCDYELLQRLNQFARQLTPACLNVASAVAEPFRSSARRFAEGSQQGPLAPVTNALQLALGAGFGFLPSMFEAGMQGGIGPLDVCDDLDADDAQRPWLLQARRDAGFQINPDVSRRMNRARLQPNRYHQTLRGLEAVAIEAGTWVNVVGRNEQYATNFIPQPALRAVAATGNVTLLIRREYERYGWGSYESYPSQYKLVGDSARVARDSIDEQQRASARVLASNPMQVGGVWAARTVVWVAATDEIIYAFATDRRPPAGMSAPTILAVVARGPKSEMVRALPAVNALISTLGASWQ